MASRYVRLRNLETLKRKLRAIPQATRDELYPAVEAQAEALTGDMKRFVPVDDGDLRDTIGWRRIDRGGLRRLVVRVFASVGEVFWGPFQEHGTVNHEATPFFFPLYRARRRSIRRAIGRAVRAAGRRAARGG